MIIGIDEAGRGAWAGPLVAAAVLLDQPLPGLTDSKLLTKAKRQKLADSLIRLVPYGIGIVTAEQIDEHGLTWAQTVAMQQALENLAIDNAKHQIIIDGSINYLPNLPNCTTLIKADQTVPAVSAASIIAKVHRDQLMSTYHLEFPHFGFDSHVGYGTKAHLYALQTHGICSLHRRSFKPIAAFA